MNERLFITVSDPWEFFEDNENCNVFEVALVDYDEGAILLYSHKPIILRNKNGKNEKHTFFATPRETDNVVNAISTKHRCCCNLIGLDGTYTSLSDAKQQSQEWRGGFALIGTVAIDASRVEDMRNSQTTGYDN